MNRSAKVKYIGMIIIGIINNVPFWAAYSNTQQICVHFNKDGYIGVVSFGITALSIFCTLTNTLFSRYNVPYIIRAIINGLMMTIGLVGSALSPNIYMAIVFLSFVGISSDFGESVMLGYFSSDKASMLLTAWGVGSGISGLIGAIYAMLCQKFNISYLISFLAMSPLGIIYPIVFRFMVDSDKLENQYSEESNSNESRNKNNNNDNSKNKSNINEKEDNENKNENDNDDYRDDEKDIEKVEVFDDDDVPFCSVMLWKLAWRFVLNMLLNVNFVFIPYQGFIDCSMTKSQKVKEPFIFGYFSIAFQFGGFVGRYISKWYITKSMEIVNVLLFIFCLMMLINMFVVYMPLLYMNIPLVFIGLLSSMGYMSIFKVISQLEGATDKEKTIVSNYASIFIGGSAQIASLLIILIQKVLLKSQCNRE